MKTILFRCDGSVGIGMGHVVRCLALAEELQESHGCNIHFAMRKSELGINKVKETYPVLESNEKAFDYASWLKDCVKKTNAHILILDVRDGLRRQDLKQIKKKIGIKVVDIDAPEDKRLEADMAFYPPVPQIKRIDWTGFTGELFVGWEWVIHRKEFAEIKDKKVAKNKFLIHNTQSLVPKVLVTMGGNDPQAMTIKAVKAIEMLDDNFKAVVVLGAGFQHKKQLEDLLSDCKHHFEWKLQIVKTFNI